jgi:lipopolysaccharide heptosyltransferase II
MTAHWDTAASVLCVRLDSLGDVLMTGPAIRAVKESAAGRRVTLLTSPAGADAAALLPDVDRVIVYDAPWMKATEPRPSSAPDLRMIERLRRERFDAAVIFTVYSQNPLPAAMLCYLADIPLRLAHCRENPYQLLTDWLPEIEPQRTVRHEVRRQLDLVAAAGWRAADERLAVRVTDSDRRTVRCLLDRLGLGTERPWVVVHPGASAPSRRYPPELFARACDGLADALGLRIVFTGGSGERALIDGVRAGMAAPSSSLAGRLTLGQLAALLEQAPLLVANNTGPVHLAAAVGTPVVDLYALTNPQHTPWAVPSRVLSYDVPCRNCYKSVCPEGHGNCLRLIPPEAVVAAAIELLAETAAPGPRKEVAV